MKKFIKYLLIIIMMFTVTIVNVKGKSYANELFQAKEKLKIEKKLEGTAFLAGKKVEINKSINGIGFIAGEDIEINDVQDYLFLAGNNIDVDANINNDIFIIGENIKVNNEIKRDAFLAGTTIVINGNINRSTYVYGTTVEIKGNIEGNININAMEIIIDKNAKINGTLKYNEDAIIKGLNNNIKTKTYSLTKNYSIGEYIYSFITSYIGITIVGLVLVYILEKVFNKTKKQIQSKKDLVNLLGKGFLILIGVPIVSMTLLMTGLFTSIGIITLIIYGLIIYVSEIFVSYLLANYLDKKYINKKLNNYMLIIIGLFIFRILSIIPIIGGFITFIVLLLGLGLLGNLLIEIKK